MKTTLYTFVLLLFATVATAQITIVSATGNAASCSNNGSATITIAGGNPVFCYRINGGACQYSGSRSHTFTGLYSGTYTITAEDGSGQVSSSVTVGGNYQEPTAWASVNGCAIMAQASGGQPPYQYAISINGGGFSGQSPDPNFTGVNGSYCIRVYDACNNFTQYCGSMNIAPLEISAACCASGGGQMCVNITDQAGNPPSSPSFWIGGLPPYTFTASSGSGTISTPDGNFNLAPACPGWTFTVTDACGNTASATADCLTAEVLCINCSDGTANIEGLFGTPPFTYEYQDPSGAWLPNPAGANNGNFSGLPTFPSGAGYVFQFRVRDDCGNISDVVTGQCLDAPATYNCAKGEAYLQPQTDFFPVTVTCNTCTPATSQTLMQGDQALFTGLSGNDEFSVTDACGAMILKTCEEVLTEVKIQRSCNALEAVLQSMYACDGNDPLPVNVDDGATYTLFLASDPSTPIGTNSTGRFDGLQPGETYIVEGVHAICGMASERTTLFNYGDFTIEFNLDITSFVRNGVCFSGYNINQFLKPDPDLPPDFDLSGGQYFEEPLPNEFKKLTPDNWLMEATNYCVERTINLPIWEPEIEVELPECPSNGGCITIDGFRNTQDWIAFGQANGGMDIFSGSDYYTLNCPDLQQATTGCEGSWDGRFCNLVPGQTNTVYLRPATGECPVDTVDFELDLDGTAKLDSVSLTTGVACAIGGFADLQAEVFGGKDPLYLEVLDNNTAQVLQTIPDTDGDHIFDIMNLQAGREFLFRIVDACGNTTDALTEVISLPDVEIEYDFRCPGMLKLFTDAIYGAEYTWLREDGSIIQKDVNLFEVDLPASSSSERFSVMINFSSCPTHTTSIDVPGFPLPIVEFSFEDTTICSANPFVLEPIFTPGNLSFEWSTSEISQSITISQSGTYIVTVTDLDNGCVSEDSVNISLSPPIFLSFEKNDLNCFGDSDGDAKITPSGGQTPYVFEWKNGVNTPTVSNLTAGTFSVTVTDDEQCRVIDSVTILQPDPLTVSASTTDANCGDVPDGTISATAAGGVAPYRFLWDDGATNPFLDNLPPGDFSIEVMDKNGCQIRDTFRVFSPDKLEANLTAENLKCYGDNSGSILTNVTGGTAPLTFNWTSSQTGFSQNSKDLSNLPEGDYFLDISDANNCKISLSKTITQPDSIAINLQKNDLTCFEKNDGKIEFQSSGGTGLISLNSSPDIGNGENLAPGNYQLIFEDENGCQNPKSVTISEPSKLEIQTNATDVFCKNDLNGTIEGIASGGTMPYVFEWQNLPNSGNANDLNVSNLAEGEYPLQVLDANGCEVLDTAKIIAPDAMNAELTTTDILCSGDATGAVETAVTGGTLPYRFSWTGGGTNDVAANLFAGIYEVEIRDANDCFLNLKDTVFQPDPIIAFAEKEDVTCFEFDNGKLKVIADGGVPTYQISSIPDLGNGELLAPGTYEITLTDDNDCRFFLTEEIAEPTLLSVDADWGNIKCYGMENATAVASASGGTAPYQYEWNIGKTGNEISQLGAGTYTVMAMDNNDCESEMTIEVTEPTALEAAFAADEIQCFGETVEVRLTASGGVAPYVGVGVESLAAGQHEFVISDQNNCPDTVVLSLDEPDRLLIENLEVIPAGCDGEAFGKIMAMPLGGTAPYRYEWSGNRSGQMIENLPAGNYSVRLIDDNNCETDGDAEVTDLPPLNVQTDKIDVSCFGFSDGVFFFENIEGGAGAPYVLDDGTRVQPGYEMADLTAGIYDYTLIDPEGCETDFSIQIDEPPLFFIEVPEKLELKLGDQLDLPAMINGSPAEPIEWNWRSNSSSTEIDCPDCPSLRIQPFHSNTFVVSAEDANGCLSKDTLQITLDRNCEVFMPSAFSPNDDGINDVIFPFAPPCVAQIRRFAIFDRWGSQLHLAEDFAPGDPVGGWDGRYQGQRLQNGVFVWFAEVVLIDGREVLFKGDLTGLR